MTQNLCSNCGHKLQPHEFTLGRHAWDCHPYPKFIDTQWSTASYDVWGNAKDGYDVNNVFRGATVDMRLRVQVNNEGTPREFISAYPSDSQIRNALGLRRFKLDLDGDDLTIYVNRERDGYPCGELHCVSHESLSPIRVKEGK